MNKYIWLLQNKNIKSIKIVKIVVNKDLKALKNAKVNNFCLEILN